MGAGAPSVHPVQQVQPLKYLCLQEILTGTCFVQGTVLGDTGMTKREEGQLSLVKWVGDT